MLGGVLDVELIDIGEVFVGSCCGVGGPGYGIVVVADEDDPGVGTSSISFLGVWSWLVVALFAGLVWCSSRMIGAFMSCEVSNLFRGVVHAFFHCGWMHILHEPHLFFVLPLVDRGVFGSVALPAGECFPDLVI